jgi:hypothetical protein
MDGYYASGSQLQRAKDMIFDLSGNFEITKDYLDYSIMKSLIGMNNLKLRTLDLEEKNKELEQRIKILENAILDLSRNEKNSGKNREENEQSEQAEPSYVVLSN